MKHPNDISANGAGSDSPPSTAGVLTPTSEASDGILRPDHLPGPSSVVAPANGQAALFTNPGTTFYDSNGVTFYNSGGRVYFISNRTTVDITPPHPVLNPTLPTTSTTPSPVPVPVPATATPQIMAPPTAGVVSAANISERDYIYFLPYPLPPGTPIPYSCNLPQNPLKIALPPFEPTSTLVLSSSTSTFLDIRILKPILPEDEPMPQNGPARRLEWAFGGKSSNSKIIEAVRLDAAGNDVSPTHSKWTHWVDSKYPVGAADIPADEGDMYPMPDGRVLEHGASFSATAGRMIGYEEMWSDVEVEACFPSNSKFSIVLRIENLQAGIRGLVVRVGQYCQGILMKGTDFTVERWEFVDHVDPQENVVGGEWTRVARIGEMFLPCAVTFKPEELKLDTRVSYTDYHWYVEELVEWV